MDNNQLDHVTVETFDNKESAERAFNAAIELGYNRDEITVLMSEEARENYYSEHKAHELGEANKSLAVGGVVGGAIGGTIGALIALGTNAALPGLGVVMVGPLASAGSVYGGLLGSLIGWGQPDDPPNAYEERLKKGEIMLIAHNIQGKPSLIDAWAPFKNST